MGKKSSPPSAPDYTGAAQAQTRGQMTSQNTPYGSETYSQDPNSPSGYRSDITLAPQAQGTLDTQMALSRGLADTANQQLPAIQDYYSKPLDYGSLSQPAYQAMTSRLDPQWQQREQQERSRLGNQGLAQGGEAYTNSMRDFNNARNDAYQQATLASLQNAQQFYNQPLNTFNSLRTGAQVQNPQFGQAPSTPYLNAAQAQGQYDINRYGIEQGSKNNMMQGLFGLGAAGISAWG